MKLLIAGSRNISKFDLKPFVSDDVDVIISGGAKGIGAVAERYADEHGLQKIVVRPQYDRYRRAAPLKRNEQMVDMADEVLVIWDGVSKGTAYTVKYAEKQGKPVHVVIP
ncbi:MAG: DUF2493 domain-containing protein [Ruminococcaceae bacterium]|nr:DUF2493 domain-containing protein [Oscillospiraceae bacterium]